MTLKKTLSVAWEHSLRGRSTPLLQMRTAAPMVPRSRVQYRLAIRQTFKSWTILTRPSTSQAQRAHRRHWRSRATTGMGLIPEFGERQIRIDHRPTSMFPRMASAAFFNEKCFAAGNSEPSTFVLRLTYWHWARSPETMLFFYHFTSFRMSIWFFLLGCLFSITLGHV